MPGNMRDISPFLTIYLAYCLSLDGKGYFINDDESIIRLVAKKFMHTSFRLIFDTDGYSKPVFPSFVSYLIPDP